MRNKIFRLILLFVTAGLVLVSLTACGKKSVSLLSSPYVRSVNTMGTTLTVTCYTPGKAAQDAVDASLKIAENYNTWATVNQSGSVVDEINAHAGLAPVKVSPEMFALIQDAYQLSDKGTGYDVTVGPLTQLWHIGFPDAKLPTQAEIDAVLPLINYKFMQLNSSEDTVYLTQKGAQLDLGSIAKGYTVKQMVTYLRSHGMTDGIVDLGTSSLYVMGHSPRGATIPWNIGITDPNKPTGPNLGVVTLENQFISTSGIYERTLKVNGQTYSHILDPKTGYPFDNDIEGVTVIGKDDSTYGDGVSTTVFALGTKAGYNYVIKNHLQAIFVDKKGQVYITPGLKKVFSLNSGSKYRLANIEDLKGKG